MGPNYLLRGQVFKGGMPSDFSMINIYTFDTATSLMYYSNTAYTDLNGQYEIYLKRGFYLVQADFAFDPLNTGYYLPTYYKNKLNWDLANVIFLSVDRDSIWINLIPYNLDSSGAGNITGMVKYGNGVNNQNGSIAPGTPAAKMLIYLINSKNNIITYTHTHENGSFIFKNVPAGNYKVWGEMAGKQTLPALANLKNNNSWVNGIEIIIGKNLLSTFVDDYKAITTADFNVYPNSVINMFTVSWDAAKASPTAIELYNMEGRLIESKAVNQMDNKLSFDMELQNSGLYLVKINLEEGTSIIKKVLRLN
ncbi:MAG: T9SS type A sorting domain-containing protein [bacterium]|nr:T9SS type A sorting domain-containing protein [bacterium]